MSDGREKEERKGSDRVCAPQEDTRNKWHKMDIHAHILPPPDVLPDLSARFGSYYPWLRIKRREGDANSSPGACMYKGDTFFRDIAENCFDAEARIDEMDRTGVTVQVLSTVPIMFCYSAKPQHTHELSQLINDHIASVCQKHPSRFVGLGTLPMQAPELAIQEMRRAHKELGLVGFEIGSHINDWGLSHPALFPVFEEAEKLGVVIFVHPWNQDYSKNRKPYWLPWLCQMPADTSHAICSLIFGGVLERLPKLKFVFAHGGGSFCATLGRIEHGFRVRPDLCAVDNNTNPREYMGKFWLDSLVHDDRMLDMIVETVGEDRVILGSDYPFPLGEMDYPGRLIEGMQSFGDSVKAKLLWTNALEFLNVPEKRFVSVLAEATMPDKCC